MKDNLKVISLFSGAGGMDIGFDGEFDVREECVNSVVHTQGRSSSHTDAHLLEVANKQGMKPSEYLANKD